MASSSIEVQDKVIKITNIVLSLCDYQNKAFIRKIEIFKYHFVYTLKKHICKYFEVYLQ